MLKQAKWLDKNLPSLDGKSFLITGSSSGVGLESAKSLLYKGAKVYFAIRNRKKCEKCIEEIKKEIKNPISYEILLLDQSKKESIDSFVNSVSDIKFDGIILNAGIYYPEQNKQAEDGSGITFYTNVIGTYLLLEKLSKLNPSAKFILTNSVFNKAPKNHDYSNCVGQIYYSRGIEYAISKRAIMNLFGHYLKNTSLFVCLTHPGITSTNILKNGNAPLIKRFINSCLYIFTHKPWKACLGQVYLVASDNVKRGDYFVPRGLFNITGYPKLKKLPEKKVFDDSDNLINVLKKL